MANEQQDPQRLSVTEAQALCFRNRIPFYSYRLPGSDETVFGAQLSDESLLFKGFEKLPYGKGFVVTPFNPASWSFPYFIKADISFTNELTDAEAIRTLKETEFNTPDPPFEISDIDHPVYLEKVSHLIDTLKRESIKKVVFSRSISFQGAAYLMAPELFERLKKYPQAFAFMVSIPGKSAWLGASPATFLTYNRDGFKTMALGGTLPVTQASPPESWPEKEQKEQQIVSDYITSILTPVFTRDLHTEGPVTLRAGNVYHLCTWFTSDEQLPADEIDRLITQLQPTPAVCGLPKKRAMQLIAETEKQERGYYTGLLGPVQANGAFDLFINLRCMELFREGYKLFVGGGITQDSDPESEWQETWEKANTLLNLTRELKHSS